MGVGPAVAIPAAAKLAGLEVSDINLFEINEVIFCHYFFHHFCKYLGLQSVAICMLLFTDGFSLFL